MAETELRESLRQICFLEGQLELLQIWTSAKFIMHASLCTISPNPGVIRNFCCYPLIYLLVKTFPYIFRFVASTGNLLRAGLLAFNMRFKEAKHIPSSIIQWVH